MGRIQQLRGRQRVHGRHQPRPQFRGEFFNLFDQWSGVGTVCGSSTFAQLTSARDPRITQFGLRLLF